MRRIDHEMIQASAGSGKTHTLVNRYLGLLASGQDPARITALTFTRKAAGEFLQKIFLRLTELSDSDEAANDLCRTIGLEARGAACFRELLSSLVKEIGRLQLGTIDQYFARVVGAFPFELGLTRPHRIMDDFEQERARSRTLEQLIESARGELDPLILQLYKNLTWGAEEKRVYDLFDDRLKNFHQQYVETGSPVPWGNAGAIYENPPWWAGAPEDKEALCRELVTQLEAADYPGKAPSAFRKILDAFESWQPGQTPNFGTLFTRLMECREALPTGTVSVTYNRKELAIPAPFGAALHGMLQYYVGAEIKRKLLISRSTGGLLEAYDQQYAQLIRETGSLVFADFPMLLVKALEQDASLFAAEDLLYRMDTLTDHWLIDEFQDTSRIQWKVLAPFVDEVLQDPEGRRSFFYVGDVKQSIYSWRGGDSRLFDEIYSYYNRNGAGIRKSSLAQSWRSGPAILDCVNQLFGSGLSACGLPGPVVDRWAANWQPHRPSPRTSNMDGYAAWGVIAEDACLGDACAHIISEADPLRRGLTCAVLVRKNDEVRDITQALRMAGIPASMEARVRICEDNVVGCWIRAFLYSVLRPGEAFPRQYLESTGSLLDSHKHDRLVTDFRQAATDDGYAEAIRVLLCFLKGLIGENRFLQLRAEQILEAATRFTGTGQDTLESFVRYIETAIVEEATLQSQVQVMTVHKAKGLDFDMVVVAGFGNREICPAFGQSLHVERTENGSVEWILDMPRQEIVAGDASLQSARKTEINNQMFEALCLLYVAMTRARQGLYCVAHEAGDSGSVLRWHHLMQGAFDGGMDPRESGVVTWRAEWGNRIWYDTILRLVDKKQPVQLERLRSETVVAPFLRQVASPSRQSHVGSHQTHSLRAPDGRRFGTWMHQFLATVEWIQFDDDRDIRRVLDAAPRGLVPRLEAFLASPVAKIVFEKPLVPCALWREKPYAIREGNTLAQGVIDRAHVTLGKAGEPIAIQLFDFKTDQLDPSIPAEVQLEERYAIQMDRYREAVVILTGLDPAQVSTRLIPV